MANKVVISNNQHGGVTTGSINFYQNTISKERKKKITAVIISAIFIIAALVAIFDYMGINPFAKKEDVKTISVASYNQTGGITAGNVNILTDKESLGIREPDGLYQDGKRVGTVFNFNADEYSNTFTIVEIEFDKPLRDQNSVWQPYEYQEYAIKINHINTFIGIPPGAKGVRGVILNK